MRPRTQHPRTNLRSLTLLLTAALAVPACKDDDPSASAPAPVQRAASQAGTAGAVAPFDGDAFDDLLLGAPFAAGLDTTGAVFVHRGTADGFEAEPAWILTGPDSFGSAVAEVGDVDGDGKADFAVGAVNGDGPGSPLSGAVTVYRGGTSGEVLRQLGGEWALDKFGTSITGRCDLNGDGHVDLVVGAPSHTPGPDRYLGGAYYVHFGPALDEGARVKIAATAETGILGFSSACGDVNADGVDDLVTAAIWTHGVRWHASKVLVHHGGPGFAPDPDAADLTVHSTAGHFGDALAVVGDVDGDGFRDVAIGVPSFYAIPAPTATNPMGSLRGRVFLVKGGAGTRTVNLNPSPPLPPGTPIPGVLGTVTGVDYLSRFGSAVEPLGDLDGDGKPDLAVSAPHGSVPGATSLDTGLVTGRTYVLLGKDLPVTGATASAAAIGHALDRSGRTLHYGSFLAAFQRGGPRLAVGAPTAERQSGTAFVEDLTSVLP